MPSRTVVHQNDGAGTDSLADASGDGLRRAVKVVERIDAPEYDAHSATPGRNKKRQTLKSVRRPV